MQASVPRRPNKSLELWKIFSTDDFLLKLKSNVWVSSQNEIQNIDYQKFLRYIGITKNQPMCPQCPLYQFTKFWRQNVTVWILVFGAHTHAYKRVFYHTEKNQRKAITLLSLTHHHAKCSLCECAAIRHCSITDTASSLL